MIFLCLFLLYLYHTCIISKIFIFPSRYEPKGKKVGKGSNSGLPPGITPEVWESMKQQQRSMAKKKIQSESNDLTSTLPSAGNHVNKPGGDEWVTVMNKKKKKQSLKGEDEVSKMNELSINNNNVAPKAEKVKKAKKKKNPVSNISASNIPVSSDAEDVVVETTKVSKVSKNVGGTNNEDQLFDPVKRLRNLRKKLKEIEELKRRDLKTLAPEQLDKIKRIHEVKAMISQLSNQVE